MEKLRKFYDRVIVLHATDESFTADGQLSRWSNKDLDPVPRAQKKWEWYHVAGFWIVAGFTPSHIQQASTNVALGLSPGLILVAYLIGNLLVTLPVALCGYIGAKVRKIRQLGTFRSKPGHRIVGRGHGADLCRRPPAVLGQLPRHC